MIDTPAKTTSNKPAFSSAYESTELLTGEAVLQLLDNEKFQEEWDQLYENCPWATVFQSRAFVVPWYKLYWKQYLPVMVKTEYGGKLTGLFTLTIDKKKAAITGAGSSVAEYQAWLTEDTSDGAFIKKALVEIRKQFPRTTILVKYMPPKVPLEWARQDRVWSKHCFIQPFSDPLMVINDEHLTAELKKKNRREKMNRLKRLGNITFERVTSYAAFENIIDELILQADFRKGARYNKVIFRNEPVRRQFLLDLFEQHILHVTVLKLNGTIIASNVGIGEKKQLYLQGINSHAPSFAKYSPGIIHFLLLGKLLAEEGVNVFDLTPGEDSYKEILATDRAIVHTLEIGNSYNRFSNQVQYNITRQVKKAAARVGINTHDRKKLQRDISVFKEKIRNLKKQGYGTLFGYFLNKLRSSKKVKRCWLVPAIPLPAIAGLLPVEKDNLHHLVSFKRLNAIHTQQEFLADAMDRFEEGGHCYTWVENDTLLACAWTANPKFSIAEYGYTISADQQAVVLSAIYWHPKQRERVPAFLRSVADKVVHSEPAASVYIVTDNRFEF